MAWTMKREGKSSAENAILIEGLPGVGNVGKIAVEYLIDALEAKKLYDLKSEDMPHYVFINQDNLIELPSIEVYTAKIGKRNIWLLSGDVQPQSESSCYAFCDTVLKTFKQKKGKEIITLGGIAMRDVPNKPSVYFTANSKKMLTKYSEQKKGKEKQLHEFVGPVVGVTGLLPGLAGKKKIPAVTMLVETYENPMHVGFNEASTLVRHLNKTLKLGLKEKNIKDLLSIKPVKKKKKSKKKEEALPKVQDEPEESVDMSYIG